MFFGLFLNLIRGDYFLFEVSFLFIWGYYSNHLGIKHFLGVSFSFFGIEKLIRTPFNQRKIDAQFEMPRVNCSKISSKVTIGNKNEWS